MDTISLKGKGIQAHSLKRDGYHGYHECSREELGLQMDSTEAFFRTLTGRGMAWKYMIRGGLSVVARDGIEPPTPAFSGLRSTN